MNTALKEHLETNAWLKDLFDNAHDLIQLVHLDGTIIYVNQSWSTTLQYADAEIQGKSIYSFIHPDDHDRFIAYRTNIINSNSTNDELVFHLLSKQGKKIAVEGIVSAKFIDGTPLYTRGIFRDITLKLQNEAQLKIINEQLRERELNLQQLLINAPDAVIVIDKESIIHFWNPKAVEIFGWAVEEVLNQPLSATIIPVQYREAHAIGMKRYLSTGEAHVLNKTIEITALHKNGTEFYVSLTISGTVQKGEQAFIAFLRDITEAKNNQIELERKTKELERSNDNLEEFAHAASHDLKEPIRKVLTFADRLKMSLQSRLNEEETYLFERMEHATRRMTLLVDDLLEYSHVSDTPPAPEDVDLREKLENVLLDLDLYIAEKNASIKIGDLPVTKGFPRQLQQLFQNLISNALKYSMPDVPPHIDISSHLVSGRDTGVELPAEENDKSFYLISVRDNGIGFEQHHAERIFKIFQRLHGNYEYKGTGVGLSIARKVVENHDGYIWAESKPGEGSTFNILLPA